MKKKKSQSKPSSKIEFYRVFIKLNEYDHKREVFAQDTTYATAIRYADQFRQQRIAYTVCVGRMPMRVVQKYNGK